MLGDIKLNIKAQKGKQLDLIISNMKGEFLASLFSSVIWNTHLFLPNQLIPGRIWEIYHYEYVQLRPNLLKIQMCSVDIPHQVRLSCSKLHVCSFWSLGLLGLRRDPTSPGCSPISTPTTAWVSSSPTWINKIFKLQIYLREDVYESPPLSPLSTYFAVR